jgi:membrane peptidoglycan carboxypeptidase
VSEINAIRAAVQNRQLMVQNEMGMQAIIQAAQADQALAEMLAENAKAVEQTARNLHAGKSSISIYV